MIPARICLFLPSPKSTWSFRSFADFGTQACVVANLKPAKLMGMLSEGMLMAAKDENGLSLLRPQAPKKSGTKIS